MIILAVHIKIFTRVLLLDPVLGLGKIQDFMDV